MSELKKFQLHIAGYEYTVAFVEIQTYNELEKHVYNGSSNFDKLRIEINVALPSERQKEILLHEIGEALNSILDLKLKHSQIQSLFNILSPIIHHSTFKDLCTFIDK